MITNLVISAIMVMVFGTIAIAAMAAFTWTIGVVIDFIYKTVGKKIVQKYIFYKNPILKDIAKSNQKTILLLEERQKEIDEVDRQIESKEIELRDSGSYSTRLEEEIHELWLVRSRLIELLKKSEEYKIALKQATAFKNYMIKHHIHTRAIRVDKYKIMVT